MMKLLVLIIVPFAAAEVCKVFKQKSVVPTSKHRLNWQKMWSDEPWWNRWTVSLEYPTLYNYTVCKNAALKAGEHLAVKNASLGNLRAIYFVNSSIPTVPVGVFIPFANVTKLFLNNSGVESVHPGAFSGMGSLQELYLQDNRIRVLERGTLNYLSELRVLDLARNGLAVVEDNSLLGLLSLRKLYLQENVLRTFALQSPDVEIVDLTGNELEEIDGGVFASLQKLHTLLLARNRLESLPSGNASSLRLLDVSQNCILQLNLSQQLQMLNASGNKIETWTSWGTVEELDLSNNNINQIDILAEGTEVLHLSWNNLTTLPVLENSGSLLELDLGHNAISRLDHDQFRSLVKLRRLHLNGNGIRHLSAGSFRSLSALMSLDLSGNSLEALEFGALDGLDNLQELRLDQNRLVSVPENAFHGVEKLRGLYLDHNSITSLDAENLLEHLKNLRRVTVHDNPWDCEVLFRLVKAFKEQLVDVSGGNAVAIENVLGIACRKTESQQESMNALLWGVTNFSVYKLLNNSYYLHIIKQNSELIDRVATFSNRVLVFISLMLTMSLAIGLLVMFTFVKPGGQNKGNAGDITFIRNDLEMR